jgi:putative endonuclease
VTTTQAGAEAEALAARYLAHQGYRILERNFRVKGGELDIVALDGAVTCFVEVRARRSAAYGRPEETIGPRKQARLILAARHWLAKHRADRCRFDAVGILGGKITLIKDAFRL